MDQSSIDRENKVDDETGQKGEGAQIDEAVVDVPLPLL